MKTKASGSDLQNLLCISLSTKKAGGVAAARSPRVPDGMRVARAAQEADVGSMSGLPVSGRRSAFLRCRTSANTGQSRQIFRAATAPDLPGIAEFVADYEVSSWYGIGAPRNTPADVVDILNGAVNAGLADPKLKKQLEDQGGIEMAGTPADFGKLIADETEKWAKGINLPV